MKEVRVCEAMNAPVGRLSDRTVCEANGGVLPRQVLIDTDGRPAVSDVMKNKTSCRTLPLIPAVEKELLKQKEKQQLYRKLCKKSYSTEYLDFVCTDQEGKLIRPNFVTEHFDWLLTKYGLKHIRFHDLRHSCASLMVMNGVSMKQVQEWLGHSTFSTTADIYAHLDYKSKQGSAGVIANLLGESKLPK